MKAFSSFALAALLAFHLPSAAHAQPGKKEGKLAIAHTLYEQATEAMDKKDYESACPKLEEVVKLVPEGLGAKMTLAECYEAQGKLATAWTHYFTLEQAASAANQKERAQKAAARAAALKPRLATLAVDIPEAAYALQNLVVRRDEIDLGEAQWGVEIPVDAGEHTITASAPGYLPWKRVQPISDGEKIKVMIALIPLGQSPSDSNPKDQIEDPDKTQSDSGANRSWQKPLSFVFLGLGGAGIAAGSILGGLTIARYNASVRDYHCDINNTCDSTGLELRNEAIAMGNGSTAAFIAGGVLSAAGIILLITSPSAKKPAKSPNTSNTPNTRSGARPITFKTEQFQARLRLSPNGIQCIGFF